MDKKYCKGCRFKILCEHIEFNKEGSCPCTNCIVKGMCYGINSGVDCKPWMDFTTKQIFRTRRQNAT